ncbi:MAG TPA: zinc-binding dehydrogenase [Candidatus Nitrosotalea sp.]|nr:zinc-binding dehydrogenase [Candidatus Nitrosotalea sp.]
MRALVQTTPGSADGLRLVEDRPDPVPADGQVLIEVSSAGVNFADVMSLLGRYPSPASSFVPGLEVAGIERGTGRPVLALTSGGAYAELAVADAALVFDASGLDLKAAGAYPLVTLTCHFALSGMARLEPGESVLILAGAGGIGSTAIQTARALGAGRVTAVASTPDKRAFALAQGADEAISYDDSFPACDVVLDGVGGEAFAKAYAATAAFGRMVLIGTSSGSPPPLPEYRAMRDRCVAIMPFSFRALRDSRPEYVAEQAPAALSLLQSGKVKPPIGLQLPLAQGAEGLKLLGSRSTMGKVVLIP